MRVTINKINNYIPEGFEVIKGNGYFYFSGTTEESYREIMDWPSVSIFTTRINDFTLDQWVEIFNSLRSDKGGVIL